MYKLFVGLNIVIYIRILNNVNIPIFNSRELKKYKNIEHTFSPHTYTRTHLKLLTAK